VQAAAAAKMRNAMGNVTRKSCPPIKVYCMPDDRERIATLAKNSGNTMSTYLLRVGLGYPVKSLLDHKRVEELCRINGDLGRLGGLLELWLTDHPRTAQFAEATIRAVLSKIEETQGEMHDVIRNVVMPRQKQ
jgi:hypothetical protein